VDSPIAYASGDVYSGTNAVLVASAYFSNTPGTTTTTLYGYEYIHDQVVTQGGPAGTPSPNTGQLFTVGSSGVEACSRRLGLDIAASGEAFAALATLPCTSSGLYQVDLATGAFSLIGTIGGGQVIRGIAIALPTPTPTPTATPTSTPTPTPTGVTLRDFLPWLRR
jgi:hypothetical protein